MLRMVRMPWVEQVVHDNIYCNMVHYVRMIIANYLAHVTYVETKGQLVWRKGIIQGKPALAIVEARPLFMFGFFAYCKQLLAAY